MRLGEFRAYSAESFAGNKGFAAQASDDFDLLRGTDTAGIIKVYKLDSVCGSYIHSHGYEPCEPPSLRQALSTPAIGRKNYEFVDVGCGKGRALIVASEMGFRRVTGGKISAMLSTPTLSWKQSRVLAIPPSIGRASNPIPTGKFSHSAG